MRVKLLYLFALDGGFRQFWIFINEVILKRKETEDGMATGMARNMNGLDNTISYF